MLFASDCLMLLAQRTGVDTLVDGMSTGFRGRHYEIATIDMVKIMLWLILALALVVIGCGLIRRIYDRICNTSAWLFWRLCRAHHLCFRDRRLLLKVARSQRLALAAELFVDPERLEAARLQPLSQAESARLVALYQQFFADSIAEEQASGDSNPASATVSPEACQQQPPEQSGEIEHAREAETPADPLPIITTDAWTGQPDAQLERL
jgi:hypothetical protein